MRKQSGVRHPAQTVTPVKRAYGSRSLMGKTQGSLYGQGMGAAQAWQHVCLPAYVVQDSALLPWPQLQRHACQLRRYCSAGTAPQALYMQPKTALDARSPHPSAVPATITHRITAIVPVRSLILQPTPGTKEVAGCPAELSPQLLLWRPSL
jgi:hypothetical protein